MGSERTEKESERAACVLAVSSKLMYLSEEHEKIRYAT